jgi:midasin
MPTIRISTPYALLGHRLAVALGARGFEVEVVAVEQVESFRLVHRAGVSSEALVGLLEALDPFTPLPTAGEPEGADIELFLGDSTRLAQVRVDVVAEGDGFAEQAREELARFGFGAVAARERVVTANALRHGDGSAFARQLVRWWAKGLGVAVSESSAPIDDDQLSLVIAAPAVARRALRERVTVSLRCDDDATRELVIDVLRARGIGVEGGPLRPGDVDARFSLQLGPLATEAGELDASGVVRAVRTALERAGIDPTRWPLSERRDEDEDAAIVLPVTRCREGLLRPYAGDAAERFEVAIRTDEPTRAAPLRDALSALGFAAVRIVPLAREPYGWAVYYGELGRDSSAAKALLAAVARLHGDDATTAAASLWQSEGGSGRHRALRMRDAEGDTITIEAPFVLASPESLDERRRAELAKVRVLLNHAPGLDVSAFVAKLRALGVRSVRPSEDNDVEAQIQVGGAHPLAVEALGELVASGFPAPLRVERVWNDRDFDVGLPLRTLPASDAVPEKPGLRRRARRARAPVSSRPFLEENGTRLRVADVWLDKRDVLHPLVPARALADGLALDDETAATIAHLARAVRLREPCLLEGETSTTKTSSILWLAARLGVPVARINLHGHTDAAELVGRHLPSAQGGWAWHDGLLLRAMREGMWVILDEVNLAEPSVVERVDALLERVPTLVLTEHDHRVFGAGGEPIHDGFRLFATMNPVGYAGRARLSPAFLDRFRAHRFVEAPGEAAYGAMLRLLVHGAQPAITLGGRAWAGTHTEAAPFAALATVHGIDAALDRVARFHVGAVEALRAETHGLSSIALPTRRALLSVLDLVAMLVGEGSALLAAVAEALSRYYLERLPRGPEREAVTQLIEAHGFVEGELPAAEAAEAAEAAQ